jgi:restriction system protein
MAVPDFQSLMPPILHILSDGTPYANADVANVIIGHFGMTEHDLLERLPSGRQTRFANRFSWARFYLKNAGLIDNVDRSRIIITERGQQVLKQKPAQINIRYLEQFPEFVEFRQRGRHNTKATEVEESATQTPEEILEVGYQSLRRTLAQELLERIKACPPAFFESLVVDLLVAMGYGGSRGDAAQVIGGSGDEGIDGLIKEDKLGLDVVYVQAKRWQSGVGRPIIQAFAGSLEGQRARKGIFITTSQFTQDAKDYVNRIEKKIVLIDGEQLANYMIDYGVGVTEKAVYVVKKVDEDYFSVE